MLDVHEKGYVDEYRFNFGGNIANTVYWGLGIGKLLLQAVIDTARQKGIDYLELDVVADNVRAIGLYEHMGFETICRLPDAIRWEDGSSHDLLTMRKVL